MIDKVIDNSGSFLVPKFVLFVILSLAIMIIDSRTPHLEPTKKLLSKITDPIKYVVHFPYQLFLMTDEFFSSHSSLLSENEKLRNKVSRYAAEAQKVKTVEIDNLHLRKQLNGLGSKMKYQFSLAEIISVKDNRLKQQSSLNQGLNTGVYTTQVVLSEGNIYGQIINVTAYSATVMQLIDPKHAIPVRNQRNGMRVLAVGTGKMNILSLKNIESTSDTRVGDTFVTSGLGELFPADYPVAKITEIKYIPGESFVKVDAKTFVDFEDTRKVVLIWSKRNRPKSILENEENSNDE